MARKLKGECEAPAAAQSASPVAPAGPVGPSVAVPADGMNAGDKGIVKSEVRFPPYTGRASLPEPIRDGKGKIIKPGAARYFVNNTPLGGELIAIYRKRCGVGRSLVRMIKDNAKDTPTNKAGSQAKSFRAQLRRAGVPGA